MSIGIGIGVTSSSSATLASSPILTSGLIIYLDAGTSASYPGSGTTWTDIQGNYNGTLVNGVGYNAGDGGYLTFDGADDYVGLGNVTQTNSASAFTMQMWMKPDDTSHNRWAGRRKDGNNRISLAFLSGKITAALGTGSNSSGSVTQALDISAWHFLTMVFDGGGAANADRLKVYLATTEKTLTFSGTIPSATYNFGASYPLVIGDDGANNYYLNGNVGQFYLYNTALTAQNISDNYDGTKSRYGL